MMEAYILMIWIGAGQAQTMAMERFENRQTCQSAREAILKEWDSYSMSPKDVRCIRYSSFK